jgi:hypothetical protein
VHEIVSVNRNVQPLKAQRADVQTPYVLADGHRIDLNDVLLIKLDGVTFWRRSDYLAYHHGAWVIPGDRSQP